MTRTSPNLYIIRRGAVELRDEHGVLVGKLAEGDLFPRRCRPRDHPEPIFIWQCRRGHPRPICTPARI